MEQGMDGTGKSTRRAFVGACFALPIVGWAEGRDAPALMRATVYRDALAASVTEFYVSEKLDGVRAFWDGERLQTRSGLPIAAPAWFTANLPRAAFDGELWGGRGTFERTSGIVRSTSPHDAEWRELKYMVFDVPGLPGTFDERLATLVQSVAHAKLEWLLAVTQSRFDSEASLVAELRRVEALGGEGVMLHRASALYAPGRSADLLKLKSFEDAEAKVVGYVAGNGKYQGVIGALRVERQDGVQFRVGSGLSDAQRRKPPPIGSWITYAYNGFTRSGRPRFARFLRVRSESDH
jgi:DNA ligase-1